MTTLEPITTCCRQCGGEGRCCEDKRDTCCKCGGVGIVPLDDVDIRLIQCRLALAILDSEEGEPVLRLQQVRAALTQRPRELDAERLRNAETFGFEVTHD